MKSRGKIAWLNLGIGINLFGLAISNFDLFGIEINPILSRVLFIFTGSLYFCRFILKHERKTIDFTKLTLVVLWSIYGSYVLSKLIGFMPHVIALILIGAIWLSQEFVYLLRHPKEPSEFNWLRISGVTILIIQFIFEIQRWPFAGPVTILVTAGYIMIGISFIRDFRIKLKEKGI